MRDCIFFPPVISRNKDNNNGTDTPSAINITLPGCGIFTENGSLFRV